MTLARALTAVVLVALLVSDVHGSLRGRLGRTGTQGTLLPVPVLVEAPPEVPPPPPTISEFAYKSYFDTTWAGSDSFFTSQFATQKCADSGGGGYYVRHEAIYGMHQMAEALIEIDEDASAYIEQGLEWAEAMVDNATIQTSEGGTTYKNWGGFDTTYSPVLSYTGNGATKNFAYTWEIASSAISGPSTWLQVKFGTAVQTSGFTITGAGSPSGGNVSFTTAPPSGTAITIRPLISHPPFDFKCAVDMVGVARVIKGNSSLNATYGTRADAVLDFVETHVFIKNMVQRGIESSYAAGYVFHATNPTLPRIYHIIRLATELHLAGRTTYASGKTYSALAQSWLGHMMTNKTFSPNFTADCVGVESGCAPAPTQSISVAGGLLPNYNMVTFNFGACGPSGDHSRDPCSPDTSHMTDGIAMHVRAYDAGFVVTQANLEAFAKLLNVTIWNQSFTTPQFRNFIDGKNGTYRDRGPWVAGGVWMGYAELGRWNETSLQVMEAFLDCMISSSCTSLSKAFNSASNSKLALAGGVTLARVRFEKSEQGPQ